MVVFSSCGNVDKPSSSHVFNGIFKTETGIKFELKEDSTTFIQFNDSIHYKGVWAIHRNDENTEYVTIEFAGNLNYYYLKDGQLYHSEREMINNNFGTKIQYLNLANKEKRPVWPLFFIYRITILVIYFFG